MCNNAVDSVWPRTLEYGEGSCVENPSATNEAMAEIFIRTPVRVEAEGGPHSPNETEPAILLKDETGDTVLRMPTPDAPGGRPHLDAVAMACMLDICRQLNEFDELLRAAINGTELEGQVELGVTATRNSERSIGNWRYTLRLFNGNQASAAIDPTSYAEGRSPADELVKKLRQQLSRRNLARR